MAELPGGKMEISHTTFMATGRTTACPQRFTSHRGDRTLDLRSCKVARWEDGQVVEEWLFVPDREAWDDSWG